MDKSAVPTVTQVALLLAPSEREGPWAREAPTRHAIRRYLLIGCGWTRSWHRADAKAASLVNLARAERKVRLPSGWDSDADLSAWTPSEECQICGRIFLQRRHFSDQFFCSSRCADRGAQIEVWAAQRAGAIGPPRCRYCFSYTEIDHPLQLYCNMRCKRRAEVVAAFDAADEEFAAKVRQARIARQIPLRDLARAMGVHYVIMAKIETAHIGMNPELRERLTTLLHIDESTPAGPLVRHCLQCKGAILAEKSAKAQFCGRPCAVKYHARRNSERRSERRRQARLAKLNGHAHAHSNGSHPDDRSGTAGGSAGDHLDPADVGCLPRVPRANTDS